MAKVKRKKKEAKPAEPEEKAFAVVDRRGQEPEPEEVEVEETDVADAPFNPYPNGIVGVAEAGAFVPLAGRVLCRAIMPGDYMSVGKGLDNIATTKGAMCFEILAIPDDVPAEWPGRVGMHFKDASASADTLDPTDPNCRYWQIWWNDITGIWWPPEEDVDGELYYPEVDVLSGGEARNVPAGMYPLQAVPDSRDTKGKAWLVVDGEGTPILERLNERAAHSIADNINARAARHDPAAPFAVTSPIDNVAAQVEATPKPVAPAAPQARAQQPQLQLGPDLYDGLDPQQAQAVYLAAQTNGPQAAVAMAENYRKIRAMTSPQQQGIPQPPPFPVPPADSTPRPGANPEDAPRAANDGAWGIYFPGQTQPAQRFLTAEDACAFGDANYRGARFEVTRVDQPPDWSKPLPAGPRPLTMEVAFGMQEGAHWGPPGQGAAAALAAARQAGTTMPVDPSRRR